MADFIITGIVAVPTIVLLVMWTRKRNELLDAQLRYVESLNRLFRTAEELDKSIAESKSRRGLKS